MDDIMLPFPLVVGISSLLLFVHPLLICAVSPLGGSLGTVLACREGECDGVRV